MVTFDTPGISLCVCKGVSQRNNSSSCFRIKRIYPIYKMKLQMVFFDLGWFFFFENFKNLKTRKSSSFQTEFMFFTKSKKNEKNKSRLWPVSTIGKKTKNKSKWMYEWMTDLSIWKNKEFCFNYWKLNSNQ